MCLQKVPYGKITLRDAVQAISKHQEDPDMWTAHRLSREYMLDLGLTGEVKWKCEKLFCYSSLLAATLHAYQHIALALYCFENKNVRVNDFDILIYEK